MEPVILLQTCVKQQFDDSSADVCVTKNSTLSEEWMMFIKESWMQVDSKLGRTSYHIIEVIFDLKVRKF